MMSGPEILWSEKVEMQNRFVAASTIAMRTLRLSVTIMHPVSEALRYRIHRHRETVVILHIKGVRVRRDKTGLE